MKWNTFNTLFYIVLKSILNSIHTWKWNMFNTVLMPSLENQLKLLKDFFSNMGMTLNNWWLRSWSWNTIRSLMMTSYMTTTTTLSKWIHTNILESIFTTSSAIIIALRKRIIGGWKTYYRVENNCKWVNIWIWDKRKPLSEALLMPTILYGYEV